MLHVGQFIVYSVYIGHCTSCNGNALTRPDSANQSPQAPPLHLQLLNAFILLHRDTSMKLNISFDLARVLSGHFGKYFMYHMMAWEKHLSSFDLCGGELEWAKWQPEDGGGLVLLEFFHGVNW